jgi:hypothetical protein
MDYLFPQITVHGKVVLAVLGWIALCVVWFKFLDWRSRRRTWNRNVFKAGYARSHKWGGKKMRKAIGMIILLYSLALVGFAQSSSKYVVGTIVEVTPVQSTVEASESTPFYHISVKVKDTVYVVRYNTSSGNESVKYLSGMQLPVLVGEDTIKFNDLLGKSYEVPIIKKKPVTISQAK